MLEKVEQVENIIEDYPIISIRDRGYLSLSYMFHSVMENRNLLFENILKNIVPIRKNRHYERDNIHKNKHSINKRKSI